MNDRQTGTDEQESRPTVSAPSQWIQLLTLLGMFVGGGGAGTLVADFAEPGSALALTLGSFMCPLSLFFGLLGWLGLAVLWLPLALVRWLLGKHKPLKKGEAFIPPGSIAFVPVALFFGGCCGVTAGLVPGGRSFVLTLFVFSALGLAYGLLAWRLARRGYLPFPDEFE